MIRTAFTLALGALLCHLPPALQAGVIVSTSLTLTSLQITPSSGTVQFLPVNASAFASALDSLGGADANFDSQDDSSVNVSALVALAAANASADAIRQTTLAQSSVNIPDFEAAASSTGQGTLQGAFQIVGTTGSVNVLFSAVLELAQSLATTNTGLSGSSEVVFTLNLPDLADPLVLFLDNPLEIGSNQSLSSSSNPTLSSGAIALDSNTPYSFLLQVDSESSGLTAPEPGCFALGAIGMCMAFLRRYRAR